MSTDLVLVYMKNDKNINWKQYRDGQLISFITIMTNKITDLCQRGHAASIENGKTTTTTACD